MSIHKIKPNKAKVLLFTKKLLPEFVCDAVNLEGIDYTLPEVQTLLDGVTIGGHKMSDQTITLNQAAAWQQLFESLDHNRFSLEKNFACELHKVAAEQEALQWGQFRDGAVMISGTDYRPPAADKLDDAWLAMVEAVQQIVDVYDKAIYVFLMMARNQFFYDVNKRMGRFIMNGLLLSEGYPAINLPAARQLEFNQLMLVFYASGEVGSMTDFMKSCLSNEIVRAMAE